MMDTADPRLLAPIPAPFFAGFTERSQQPTLREPFQERRQHARLDYKVPVMLSDNTGTQDHFVTEEVSKGGFSFISERLYIPGEVAIVNIRCGYSTALLQASVRIVRREDLGKTGRRLYGATYLRSDAGAFSN
jgi:PilZ domain-containing protein